MKCAHETVTDALQHAMHAPMNGTLQDFAISTTTVAAAHAWDRVSVEVTTNSPSLLILLFSCRAASALEEHKSGHLGGPWGAKVLSNPNASEKQLAPEHHG